MKVARLRTRRRCLRFAWLALLALLFQQAALAAYVCPTEMPPSQALMAGCEGMEMPDQDAPALCDQHCQRDHSTTPELRVAQVPPLELPQPYFDLAASLLPPAHAQYYEDVPTCRSDPPAAERFCSLQI